MTIFIQVRASLEGPVLFDCVVVTEGGGGVRLLVM